MEYPGDRLIEHRPLMEDPGIEPGDMIHRPLGEPQKSWCSHKKTAHVNTQAVF